MTWEAQAQDFLADLSRRPAARAPATLGEVWSTEWSRSGLDTLFGVRQPLENAYEKLATEAAAEGIDVAAATRIGGSPDERAQMIREAVAALPEETRKRLEPLLDIRRRAAEEAHKRERESAEVEAVNYGLSGAATSFAAGVARQAVDPLNLATLPLGGPLKGPVIPMLLREAGIGAAIQAAQEPGIQSGRAELGLEAGVGPAAGNIGQAALGAAGMAGLFRAGAWGLRAARDRFAEAPGAVAEGALPGSVRVDEPAPAAAPEARTGGLTPEDLDAAARLAERDQMVDQAAPGGAQVVDDAAAAIERGQSIPAPAPAAEIIRGQDFRARGDVDMGKVGEEVAARVDAALKAGSEVTYYIEDKPVRIVSVDRGMMTDADGQRWGTAQLLMPAPGTRTEIEIVPRAPEAVSPLEPPTPTAALPEPPPKPRRGPASRPAETWSLLEYLSARGGIREDDPLIADLRGMLGKKSRLIPGFGPLIRKPVELSTAAKLGGKRDPMTLDQARAAAVEGGYLFDIGDVSDAARTTTINDLFALIDKELRGERQYRAGMQGYESKADAKHRAERNAAELEREIDARLAEAEIDPATIDPTLRKRVTEMVTREGETDIGIAYERAIMEDYERHEGASRARRKQEPEIPGWDVPDDGGAAPRDRGRAADRSGPGSAADRGERRDGGEADRVAPGQDRGGGEAAEPAVIGDPTLAREAERVIAQHGDFEIQFDGPGGRQKMKFSDAMRQAANDDEAARVLAECIGAPGGAA